MSGIFAISWGRLRLYPCSKVIGGALEGGKAEGSTFYTYSDFQQIKAVGLNSVRIPLGYWAVDLESYEPYVQGQVGPELGLANPVPISHPSCELGTRTRPKRSYRPPRCSGIAKWLYALRSHRSRPFSQQHIQLGTIHQRPEESDVGVLKEYIWRSGVRWAQSWQC